ncbi:MAG: TetR/AcrR family transcriptional regulator C-terminal ligand-binding domain-containing protein [Actinomycetia bacterium]|nr:TetR/AcrR family transcriptional regulator C-terminal ligand-binding domain-containing protein [Actinomycetes bacterium]
MTNSERPTNPQVQRTQKLMLDAARGLLADHGPEGVTHLRVAGAAGVARATVYRHWPDRAAILLDLLRTSADLDLAPPPPDSSITERVVIVLRTFAKALNGDGGRTLAAMIGLSEWDDDVFAALGRMATFGPMFLRSVLSDAVEQGLLDARADPALLADRLIGPLYFRRLLYHEDIENVYVDRLVEATIGPHLVD